MTTLILKPHQQHNSNEGSQGVERHNWEGLSAEFTVLKTTILSQHQNTLPCRGDKGGEIGLVSVKTQSKAV